MESVVSIQAAFWTGLFVTALVTLTVGSMSYAKGYWEGRALEMRDRLNRLKDGV